MKSLNLLLIALVALFVGCGKEDRDLLEVDSASIQGRWELRHVLGVQIADAPSDFEAGNGNIIEFDGQRFRQISQYEEEAVTSDGTYEVVEVEPIEIDGTKYRRKIIFTSESEHRTSDQFVKISGNKLMLSTGSRSHDGSTATYDKI
ncbi:hypothetical protein [Olivibacter sp. XZL3]|uniref:hypothetical protein n=1 Tax=Olivibacter sp. XZL3 TaxID=1735116 RepID=UPI0010657C4B|nr:hypothetical protein [Olivibacter sp. XZL3]